MNRGQTGKRPYWNRCRQRGSWRHQNRGRSSVQFNARESQNANQIHNASSKCLNEPSSSSSSSDNPYNEQSQVNETEPKVVNFSAQSGPYAGWKLYITDELYEANNETVKKLKLAEKYCKKLQIELGTENIESKGSFNIELKDLIATEYMKCNWNSFVEELRDSSEKMVNYFGLAMHQIITEDISEELAVNMSFSSEGNKTEPVQCNIPKIHARFVGFEPLTPLKQIKAGTLGKFVSIKGTVVRVSNVKPLCIEMAFSCNKCRTTQAITQPDGKYTLPKKCVTKGCRSHQFSPLRESSLTKTIDWQDIRLQEIVLDGNRDSGRVPRTIECKLMYDLVDCCVPGDIITISGIIKVISSQENNFNSSKEKCMFLLYILANSIVNCRENSITKSTTMSLSLVGMELNAKDMCAIETIKNEPNLFRLLTASLCPSIFGHEMVKAGLILGLIGGTRKFVDDKNRIPIRGDPHILVVGDPGLGKSQMLQACANIVPRGVYVCGNTTTTSGLTVTLTKEGASSEYALEAGALVLADQGCCCIDEFDKMSNQHHALLEAMEQQTISIAKGGMVCSLPARTSIIAAANPVGGHYNKAKTVSENLKMGSALLSRFDLVFILLDKPNQELDCKLSEHVIALHSNKDSHNLHMLPHLNGSPVSSLGCHSLDSERPLSKRLKFQPEELDLCDPIPHQLLRKYIAFAREKSKPKLTPEASQVLQQFYLELRKNYQTSDCTPITTRQLESMIRLTEARARIQLRDQCTRQDALDIVELTKYSMVDTYSDQFGLLHFQRSQHGSGMSCRSKAKKFITALTAISQKTCSASFTVQQMKQINNELKLDIPDFQSFLSSLNNQGFLLKKGSKLYELQTTEF